MKEDERTALGQLSREGFDSPGGELEERISRAGIVMQGRVATETRNYD